MQPYGNRPRHTPVTPSGHLLRYTPIQLSRHSNNLINRPGLVLYAIQTPVQFKRRCITFHTSITELLILFWICLLNNLYIHYSATDRPGYFTQSSILFSCLQYQANHFLYTTIASQVLCSLYFVYKADFFSASDHSILPTSQNYQLFILSSIYTYFASIFGSLVSLTLWNSAISVTKEMFGRNKLQV